MPLPVEPATLSPRAWAWWALGTTAALCVLVATFNAVVDPTAQLGTGVLDPVAAGPRDRAVKLELLAATRPDLVVLGSSRTKKLDPAWLGGERGVNAAVVGGDLFEARVFAAYAAARPDPPQLVVGVDVEQFRDSSLHGSGFLAVPGLAPLARAEAADADGTLGDALDRAERLLLSMQVTRASLASVRARLARTAHAARRDDATQRLEEYLPSGVLASDARWEQHAARLSARTPARVAAVVAEYEETYLQLRDTLDADAVDDLRALASVASEAGAPAPLVYVTPAHPRFASGLADAGRDRRLARVRGVLEQLERDRAIRLVDCSSCIEADPRLWIDATHPSPLGMRQLALRLAPALEA